MSGAKRADAGAAVSALFARTSATGGLARRDSDYIEPRPTNVQRGSVDRLRQGVELTESDVDYLRSLSRPGRTGQPRTLGSKFVATGLLAAAIEVIRERGIDMTGVEAADLDEMTRRALDALTRESSNPSSPDESGY